MAVYLDNNATTALDERVLQAMLPYMGQVTGNPSSVHRFGRLQKDAIEQARESVARLVGARAEQVVFTSGGTESNNLLINGFYQHNRGSRIAVSAIEHMSLLEPAQNLGDMVDIIEADENGHINNSALEQAVDERTSLVSVMTANNETGVIQDLSLLIDFAAENNCFFHTDATQAAGKIALDFAGSGIHAMTVSAHKLYGPVGVGALIIDKRLPIKKLQFGGSQEKNLRAGTENVPAIVGFGKAAELAMAEMQMNARKMYQLRDALEKGLKELNEVSVFADRAERLPNTLQFGVNGFDGETLLMQLDRKAIAVSSGSACTSGKTEPSHVLKAMKVPDALANSAIRVSFGKHNTMSDVEALLAALHDIIEINQQSAVMMAATV
ncbi:MAG: cysteine desulfurase [Gammaproteobacteria bacterium]|nr:cysteine desulfurase [Gammaproteobacteria bacterium]MBT8133409.1 cysteine desulfurase [Gammaproteobacteria bacterium]NNJ49261.1 cysteine desulfurase [Gammaproteobacteria bacterium]